MRNLIVGSQALANGVVTEHDLRRWYDRMFRDIYTPKGYEPTLLDRIDGAWLRSGRNGVVAGVAASALHGAQWVDADIPVELIWDNTRPPPGIIARDERLENDEITTVSCISVTTSARTAYDLGRHLPRSEAIPRLDALMRATPFSMDEVLVLAKRHRRARGLTQLRAVLPLVDGGAASPQETRLRLLFIDAGFPRPTTQIPVVDGRGRLVRLLDMGWEDFMVAAEYDGDHHRTNRRAYVKDVRVLPKVERLGWNVIRVIKEDRDEEILDRAYRALIARGWDGRLRPPSSL
ncbi:MAG TPA: hypothetical protein VJ777_17320 [Mycobacterium sp.]|nr:hypothetical protein [Aeromicrobium sp.]HJT93665.1 hypothetical protein [Mycobacterium sp.]